MPEAEPRAEDTDAAPGTDQATPDSEQPTLFPEADAPPEGGLDRDQATASPEDEWDSMESAPAADPFATGVLEIVTSLDTGEAVGATTTEPTSDAVTDTPTTDTISEVTTEEVPSSESPVAEAEEPASEATPEMTEATALEPAVAEAVPATEPAAEAAPARAPKVPWWPFAVYIALWVIGLGVAAYLMLQVPADRALYEQQLYGYFVLGGLVLTALGPLLIPFVWLLARAGVEKDQRGGLFARTALWGALSTLLGVALWWGTLVVLDAVRLGSPL